MTTGTPARLSLNGQEYPFYGKFLTAARLTEEMHAVVSSFPSSTGSTSTAPIQHLAAARQMKSTSADNPPIEDRASNLVNDGLVRRPAQDRTRLSLASQVLH